MRAVERHTRCVVEDDDVVYKLRLQGRRAWEAYCAWEACYTRSVLGAAALPLWQRIRRRRLRRALEHWKRVDRILTAQNKFKRLVDHQRSYLLRKLSLKRYWRSVLLAFDRWVRVCRCYVRLERQVIKWRRKTAMGLAVAKWRSIAHKERLEEEAAACLSVLSHQKLERLALRVLRRAKRERLVSCWIQWRTWYRRQRCLAWRRGLSFAMGKYFAAWKCFFNTRRQQRMQVESFARGIVLSVMEDSVAQCLWRQRVRDEQTDRLTAVLGLLWRWMKRVQIEQLRQSLSTWKLHAFAATDAEKGDNPRLRATSPMPAPVASKPRFPQRFTAAYRAQKRHERSTPTHEYPSQRPQWR